jgi:hypothetical protein
MQKSSFRRVRSPQISQEVEQSDICHFSLQDLLPSDQVLALNLQMGTLSLLSLVDNEPVMLEEQQFTTSEVALLLPLLEAYPYYSPYEVLYASFNTGRISEKTVERARKCLLEAQETGTWDQEMRPVRNVLSRMRLKLRIFSIEISSILETGYMLMIKKKRRRTTDRNAE